ncbi:MAG: HPr family phosphocarrier protein, partial [Bacillota bacterium]|jgi:phosphocarrier protein|nr:HPr family phosphocarrier protein [Bacillota bacterium]
MKFKSEIKLISKEKSYNAKSIISILSMGAKKGAEIRVEASGPDEQEAVERLADMIESGFGEI